MANGDSLEYADALDLLGSAYYNIDQADSALKYYKIALDFSLRNKYDYLSSSLYTGIGNVYYDFSNYILAIDYYYKALEIEGEMRDASSETLALLNISYIHIEQGDLAQAEEKLRKGIELTLMSGDTYFLSSLYNALAEVLLKRKKITESSINLELAFKYLQEEFSLVEFAYYYLTKASLLLEFEDFEESKEAAQKGIDYAAEFNDPYTIAEIASKASVLYFRLGDYRKGLVLARAADGLARNKYIRMQVAYAMFLNAKALNIDDLALESHIKFHNLSDSIKKVNVDQKLSEYIRQDEQKFNETILAQNRKYEKAIYRNKLLLYSSIILLIGCVILIAYIASGNRRKQAYNNILKKQNATIKQKQLELDSTSKDLEKQNKILEDLNANKNKIFNILSHDLRNPFNQLKGVFELLAFEEGLSKDLKEVILPGIKDSIYSSSDALDNILQWSKNQLGGIKTTFAVAKLKPIVSRLRTELTPSLENKKLTIDLDIDPMHNVLADMDQIEIILRNLIVNAVKFSQIGGKIIVKSNDIGKEIRIDIRDFGVGMSQEKIEELNNEEFSSSARGTLNESGTGLGMRIVKEFVDNNKGKLLITSTETEGSTFSIFFEKIVG